MCVGFPESHTTMVRYSTWKHTLLSQLVFHWVPAENSSYHFVLVITTTSNEELVIAGGNATAGPLTTQLDYERPGVFQRTVGIQGLHRTTFILEEMTYLIIKAWRLSLVSCLQFYLSKKIKRYKPTTKMTSLKVTAFVHLASVGIGHFKLHWFDRESKHCMLFVASLPLGPPPITKMYLS